MADIEKIKEDIARILGTEISFSKADAKSRKDAAVYDDGKRTFFSFRFKNTEYVGEIEGATEKERGFAALLPSYIESFEDRDAELSKTERLKRILLGEYSLESTYKYMAKYSLSFKDCFVLAFRLEKPSEEALSLIAQYGGNSFDTVVPMDEKECVLVKFVGENDGEYRSPTDYAEFLVQSLKEELALNACVGVGSRVASLKDAAVSYAQAATALRYAGVFSSKGSVHSYKEYMLVKMLEDVSKSRLSEYLAEMTDENAREIFEDAEMVNTAEEFLQNSLNVSETSRKLYMHRNTLLYRLDKIEKATGLNIRLFSDAVSFRVLTILYKLTER